MYFLEDSLLRPLPPPPTPPSVCSKFSKKDKSLALTPHATSTAEALYTSNSPSACLSVVSCPSTSSFSSLSSPLHLPSFTIVSSPVNSLRSNNNSLELCDEAVPCELTAPLLPARRTTPADIRNPPSVTSLSTSSSPPLPPSSPCPNILDQIMDTFLLQAGNKDCRREVDEPRRPTELKLRPRRRGLASLPPPPAPPDLVVFPSPPLQLDGPFRPYAPPPPVSAVCSAAAASLSDGTTLSSRQSERLPLRLCRNNNSKPPMSASPYFSACSCAILSLPIASLDSEFVPKDFAAEAPGDEIYLPPKLGLSRRSWQASLCYGVRRYHHNRNTLHFYTKLACAFTAKWTSPVLPLTSTFCGGDSSSIFAFRGSSPPTFSPLSFPRDSFYSYLVMTPHAPPEKVVLWLWCGGKDMLALDWLPFLSGLLHYSLLHQRKAPYCVLVDYPGHGLSEGTPSPEGCVLYALQSLSTALRRIPKGVRVELRLLGYSLGAAVVLQVAIHLSRLLQCRQSPEALHLFESRLKRQPTRLRSRKTATNIGNPEAEDNSSSCHSFVSYKSNALTSKWSNSGSIDSRHTYGSHQYSSGASDRRTATDCDFRCSETPGAPDFTIQDDILEHTCTLSQVVLISPFTTTADCAANFIKLPTALVPLAGSMFSLVQDPTTKWDNLAAVRLLVQMYGSRRPTKASRRFRRHGRASGGGATTATTTATSVSERRATNAQLRSHRASAKASGSFSGRRLEETKEEESTDTFSGDVIKRDNAKNDDATDSVTLQHAGQPGEPAMQVPPQHTSEISPDNNKKNAFLEVHRTSFKRDRSRRDGTASQNVLSTKKESRSPEDPEGRQIGKLRIHIVHGSRDSVVPCEMGRRVYKTACDFLHTDNTLASGKSAGYGRAKWNANRDSGSKDATVTTGGQKANKDVDLPEAELTFSSSDPACTGVHVEYTEIEGADHRNICTDDKYLAALFEVLTS